MRLVVVVVASVLLGAAACGRISFEPIGATTGDATTAANGNMTADAPITAGSQTATFTLDSGNDWIATIVEFRCP